MAKSKLAKQNGRMVASVLLGRPCRAFGVMKGPSTPVSVTGNDTQHRPHFATTQVPPSVRWLISAARGSVQTGVRVDGATRHRCASNKVGSEGQDFPTSSSLGVRGVFVPPKAKGCRDSRIKTLRLSINRLKQIKSGKARDSGRGYQ